MNRLSKNLALAALSLAATAALPSVYAYGEDVKYTTVQRDDMPKEVRHEADAQARGAKDVKYQRQSRDGKTFYSVHYTTADNKRMEVRLDESGKVVDGPHAAKDQTASGGSSSGSSGHADDAARTAGDKSGGNNDADVKYHGISARDVDREVPKAVRQTMDKYTKNGKDLFYQSQIRGGKEFYSVHYTTQDNKRMFVRVAENGELALGPAESQTNERNAANPTYGRDAGGNATADANRNVETKREAISVDQLPAAVRKTVETATNGGSDHSFVKQTRGSEVTYVVEYTKSGARTSALITPDGKIIEGETASAIAAAPVPNAQPVPTPAANQPANAADAQLASAKIGGPYQLLSSADELPPAVRAAATQELNGATDPLFQRFTQNGKTVYASHYTAKNGQRKFLAVDDQGKVVVEPRKSNWQEGGKNAMFQPIGVDQLPAPVRQQVQTEGGSNHVFVLQSRENGKKEYLVQYTAADGQRMEYTVGEDGKLDEKPRKARDNPFTIIERGNKKD